MEGYLTISQDPSCLSMSERTSASDFENVIASPLSSLALTWRFALCGHEIFSGHGSNPCEER